MNVPAKLTINDRVITQLQDNMLQTFRQISLFPLIAGLILYDVELEMGDNTVFTTLPVVVTGWIVTRKNAAADIYDKNDENDDPKTLILNSSAAVRVDLFVF